ncbi:serpentine type 7TM GPCR chemoreceptor srd domain-containing protein [Ditylenchus destructor]|uniref:Serpentine type 7TM GPCR chemoreceptor srd domain-containing protein n=1 Tax=Ditylenchus destructor TaxID=166010 RepID=A0AAD4MS39_9BILA|nr:serpentine type 7TM GPCR chemoreceptor srd domain-containing protein [Ditylenchus destructor]
MSIAVSAVHETNCWIVVTLGLVLNSVLIFLIFKQTSKEMRIYSRILLQTAFIDFCCLLTTAFVQPIYLMYNGHNVVITNGLLRSFGQSWAFVMTMWWFFIGCFSIISNCVPFIYRYLVLCREKVISPLCYASILLVCVLFSIIFVGAVIWATHPDDEQLMKINLTTMELSNFLNQPNDMAPLRIGFMVKADNYRWAISSLYGMSLEIVCYIIIFICGVKIKRNVRAAIFAGCYNPRLMEVNRQLSVVLLFQTILPAFELGPSMACLITSVFFGSSTNIYFISFATLSMQWIAVLNPLVTIIVVKPYRNYFLPRKNSISPNSSLMRRPYSGNVVHPVTLS